MNSGTDRKQTIPETVADEAGAWDARLRSPDCTDDDRARFAAWRDANPLHQQTFERLQVIVATLRHERSRADIRALRDEPLRESRHGNRRFWLSAAAAAIAVFAIGSVVLMNPGRIETLITRLSGMQVYSTNTGQRSTFVLADGSSIDLNALSRVEVRFSDTRRDVTLVEGQALFNVARDERRAFIVHAGNRQVVAVGTRFDVRLNDTSVQVTLLEGRVRVEQIELTPGKQLIARLDTSAQPTTTNVIRDIDVAKVTGWREGRIYFDDLRLDEAIREMNRHSSVHIRIESPALAELRINGMFKAGEQELFVSALQDYFQIVAQHRGAREIVLTNVP
jgi:transmembrane sensor